MLQKYWCLIIILFCVFLTVNTAPLRLKCLPCALLCSVNNTIASGPSCRPCQCEPSSYSSYNPTSRICNYEPCHLRCGSRGLQMDARGCPVCQCRIGYG